MRLYGEREGVRVLVRRRRDDDVHVRALEAHRRLGADLVGMSLVPEALAAVQLGFRLLSLVGVTQMVNPESHKPASIESMLDAADLAAPRMGALLTGILRKLTP